MNTFTTLLWLEVRKYSSLALILLGAVALCYWLFSLITGGSAPRGEDNAAVLGLGFAALVAGFMGTSFFYGAEAQREYRGGRWPLLLGSPVPGWVQLAARLTFVFALLTLYAAAMIAMVDRFGLQPLGVGFGFGSYLSLWVYFVGGLPVMLLGLFLGMLTGAYLPTKLGAMAGVASVLGVINLGGLLAELLRPLAYTLPGWRVALPTLPPGIELDGEMQISGLENGLPTEVFVALVLGSVLLYVLSSRMWEEVEA